MPVVQESETGGEPKVQGKLGLQNKKLPVLWRGEQSS